MDGQKMLLEDKALTHRGQPGQVGKELQGGNGELSRLTNGDHGL